MTTKPLHAGIYCRISLARNGEDAGVTRQQDECRALAERIGWTVAGAYVDNDISASTGKHRPGYRRLLDDLEAGRIDGVLAWHPDRVHRRPIELEEFISIVERCKVPIATVQAGDLDLSTPSGRAVARMVGAMARHEVELKSERQKSSHAQRARDGRPPTGGHRLFGYTRKYDQHVPAEADAIRWAAKSLLSGGSVHGIAREWNRRGLHTTLGNPWRNTEVRTLLKNPRLAALSAHNGVVVGDGKWPPLLDLEGKGDEDAARKAARETHYAIIAELDRPERHKAGAPRTYLLSGVAVCGVCSNRIYGGAASSRGRPAYRCTSGHVYRAAPPVEDYVEEAVVARLERDDTSDLFAPPGQKDQRRELLDEENDLKGKQRVLAEVFGGGGSGDEAALAAGVAANRARLAEIAIELESLTVSPALARLANAEDVQAEWDSFTTEEKRAVLPALVRIVVHPPGQGAKRFDPDTVGITFLGDETG